jgi:aldehyde dehydrogenase (NAD+)
LYDDFKKPAFEAVITETNYVISELKETIRIYTNGQSQKKFSHLFSISSTDYIYKEPYGKVLIIAPWNYPSNWFVH